MDDQVGRKIGDLVTDVCSSIEVGRKIGDLVTDVCSSIESLKPQVAALNAQVDGIFPASIKALSDRVMALENALKELQARHEHSDGPGLEFRL